MGARTNDERRATRFCRIALAVALCGAVWQPAVLSAGGAKPVLPGTDFGAGITLSETADLTEVVDHPDRYVGKPILVSGRISDVCQMKGCWTVLSRGDAHMRVRFEDYGFFLPKDSSGKQAYVQGVVKADSLSAREAAHYATESKEAVTAAGLEARREVQFTATGVRLVTSPPAGT